MNKTHHIVLELTRAENADDPYAFSFRPQEYLLRTEGGGFRTTELSWNDALLDDLEDVRTPGCEPAVVQRMGDRLHKFLVPADFAHYERLIANAVDDGESVHITIRSAAAELYVLPWELLTIRATGQHLAELPNVLIKYHWPETRSTPTDGPLGERGRVLMIWSAAGGRVPADEHRQAIYRAATRGHYPFDRDRDVLADVSLERLDEVLAEAARSERPVSVLHILAHGAASGDTFGLAFDGDNNKRAVVDPGRLRQILAPYASTLRLVVLCACDSGNLGELGNHLGSVAQNLHSAGIASVIASRFPLSVRGSRQFSSIFYNQLFGVPSSLEHAFLTARQKLAHDAKSLDWASLQLYGRPEDGDDTRPVVFRPYRGLLPFRAEHARFFFGRSAEIAETLLDMDALVEESKPRLLVVAGASGTGKSSVVMAGAIPELSRQAETADRESDDSDTGSDASADLQRLFRILEGFQEHADSNRVRQSVDEVRQRAEELRQMLVDADSIPAGGWEIAVMRLGRAPLDSLRATLDKRQDPGQRFLLVIDQFEELFTMVEDVGVRQAFAQRLWRLCRERNGVHCIVTVRVDFLGHGGEIVMDESGIRLDQVAYDEAHRVFVAQMSPEQMRAAIEEPARLVGLQLERGLATTMLSDVGAEPGALPLVQYTLDLLWQRRRGRLLSADVYHELGGVTGALQRKADTLIDSFDSLEQKQARRLLVRLVGVGEDNTAKDTRRRARLAMIRPGHPSDQQAFDKVLGMFIDARLLVPSEDGGHQVIEVAHEALIRKWDRLRQWLSEDRDKLVELQELERWAEQYRNYGTLLDGEQLGYAQMVREKHPDDCDASVTEMIDASEAHREHLRRRTRRRLQAALILALVVAFVMSGLGLWAYRESEVARSALSRAEQERLRAEGEEQKAKEEQARAERERARAEEEKERAEEQEQKAIRKEQEALQQRTRAEEQEAIAQQRAADARREWFRAEGEKQKAQESETKAKQSEAQAVASEAEAKKARDETARLLAKEKQRTRKLQKQLQYYTDNEGLPGVEDEKRNGASAP